MFAAVFGCEGFFAHVCLPLVQQQQEWSRIFPSPRGELKKDFSIDKYYAGLSIKRGYKAYKLRKEVHSRIDEKEHIAQRPRRKSDASKLLCVFGGKTPLLAVLCCLLTLCLYLYNYLIFVCRAR